MEDRRARSTFFDVRACVVVAALVSLCISSNVGPRFLPLPAIPDGSLISRLEPQGGPALRQSHGEADDFRVPMMSQTQKRTDREPQPLQLAVLPAKNALISLCERQAAIERHWTNLLEPPCISLFFGRAPPPGVRRFSEFNDF